jgi:DNA-binding NarL/FixJ family response regulator
VKGQPPSNKQREVCYLLLRGVETGQIALMLSITRTTLKEHTQEVYRKPGVARRAELIRVMTA